MEKFATISKRIRAVCQLLAEQCQCFVALFAIYRSKFNNVAENKADRLKIIQLMSMWLEIYVASIEKKKKKRLSKRLRTAVYLQSYLMDKNKKTCIPLYTADLLYKNAV